MESKKRVSQLYYFLRDSIEACYADLVACKNTQVKLQLETKLKVLQEVKSICEKRNRY